jgi:hypothetical protein
VTAEPVTACLLHGDYHVMDAECWGAVLDWQDRHQHLSERQRRNAYQAAVEKRALAAIRKD